MKTDDLIESLAQGLTPAPPRRVPLRLAAIGAAGAATAVGLVAAWLGFRPDLAQAIHGPTFWMKALYALVLGLAGFMALERLARPAASPRNGLILAMSAVAVLAMLGVMQVMMTPDDARLGVWLGRSWRNCPRNILALAAPMLAIGFFIVRRFAPTRLTLTGAATGLFAGGVAATAYGLHCPETAPAFVATWYSLGMALSTAAGGLLGPLVLRWR